MYIAKTVLLLAFAGLLYAQDTAVEPKSLELGVERNTAVRLCPQGMKLKIDLITGNGKEIDTPINPHKKGVDPDTTLIGVQITNPRGKLQLSKGFSVQYIFPSGPPETFPLQTTGATEGLVMVVTYSRSDGETKGKVSVGFRGPQVRRQFCPSSLGRFVSMIDNRPRFFYI
jgi:hypothetical protein